MKGVDLVSFSSADLLAENVATHLIQAVAAHGTSAPFYLALSGGRIASRFFRETARQARFQAPTFNRVEFFWADERCVGPADADSNYRLAQEDLLGPLSIDPSRVHRIRGELDSRAAALEAALEMLRLVPASPSKQPLLDLVILGMGEDGHVASLFPGDTVEDRAPGAVYVPVVGPKPPPNRVSLSYGALVSAKNVWVLASGTGKEQALADSLKPRSKTPLGQVLAARRGTRILTDIQL